MIDCANNLRSDFISVHCTKVYCLFIQYDHVTMPAYLCLQAESGNQYDEDQSSGDEAQSSGGLEMPVAVTNESNVGFTPKDTSVEDGSCKYKTQNNTN